MPPKPCKRNTFLFPSLLELKWSFSVCKYSSRPVKEALGSFRGGKGGKAVFAEGGSLKLFILSEEYQ